MKAPPQGKPLDLISDAGCAADGVTDDADRIQDALLSVAQGGPRDSRRVKMPNGQYALSHPFAVPPGIWLQGDAVATGTVYGSTLVIRPDFNLDWNGVTTHPRLSFRTAAIQSSTYAADPTGQHRWDDGDWWHGNVIENISVVNPHKLAVNGLNIHMAAEQTVIRNCSFRGCMTGMNITGGNAPFKAEGCHFLYSKDCAIKLVPHAVKGGTAGGTVRLYDFSGDNNGYAFVFIAGSHNVILQGLKYEACPAAFFNVVRFDSSNVPNRGPGNRAILTMVGCNVDPGVMDNAIEIFNTGQTDGDLHPTPTIVMLGCKTIMPTTGNLLFDHTNGKVFGWTVSQADPAYGIGSGVFVYSADVDEKEKIAAHSIQMIQL